MERRKFLKIKNSAMDVQTNRSERQFIDDYPILVGKFAGK